jgi:hypothetical protein
MHHVPVPRRLCCSSGIISHCQWCGVTPSLHMRSTLLCLPFKFGSVALPCLWRMPYEPCLARALGDHEWAVRHGADSGHWVGPSLVVVTTVVVMRQLLAWTMLTTPEAFTGCTCACCTAGDLQVCQHLRNSCK